MSVPFLTEQVGGIKENSETICAGPHHTFTYFHFHRKHLKKSWKKTFFVVIPGALAVKWRNKR